MRLLIVVILTDPAQQKEQDEGHREEEEVGGSYVIDVRQPRRDVPGPPECHDDHQQRPAPGGRDRRSEEHTSELQSPCNLVCRLLLEKKKKRRRKIIVDMRAEMTIA